MNEELINAMREFVDFEIRELKAVYDDIPEQENHARIRITEMLARLLLEKTRLENQLKPAIVETDDAGKRNRMTVEQQEGESHDA